MSSFSSHQASSGLHLPTQRMCRFICDEIKPTERFTWCHPLWIKKHLAPGWEMKKKMSFSFHFGLHFFNPIMDKSSEQTKPKPYITWTVCGLLLWPVQPFIPIAITVTLIPVTVMAQTYLPFWIIRSVESQYILSSINRDQCFLQNNRKCQHL